MCSNPADLCLALIAIIFPPIAVWIKRGLCTADSLINLALCCLGFLPGLLHAWYIIASTPVGYGYEPVSDVEAGPRERAVYGNGGQPGYVRDDARSGGVSYYYVQHNAPLNAKPTPNQQVGQGSTVPQNYGTVGSSQGGNEVPPTYNEAIKGDNKVQRS